MSMQQTNNIDSFRQALKRHSLKATPQRLAVHEAMMELGHASADMVTDFITNKAKTKVTLASVYNILTQLSGLGIYNYRMSHTNKMFFDVNTFKHMHLYDSVNHTFKDIIDDELTGIIESHLRKKRFKGYSVDDIEIQLIVHPTKKRTANI